ncbi:MAG TPA: type II toxin-antitoxin system RelE/ParE family toxin [Bacteroidales bacterium]|jgi:mRNA-degrading endonuclease RelE of RelBE toxin-antitoxin system|nr:type II toxin-antitoxin system RelE/ParE family toxin [Bacteroidales bacterium]HOX74287.1 type II toxin-antitoxin system RelE/ParE family toxin [Bacteroidales bacterium]HQM68636.1 type II toxin-antitoxin system RelE/ParE family toxin [Bacteroidales bacterium]
MNYKLIITSAFKRDAKPLLKKYKSLKNDLAGLIESLENEPVQGKPLGKDCYKIRLSISSKGKGKSGGARVITCIKIISEKVFLLTIYDKSYKEDISDKELNELLKFI